MSFDSAGVIAGTVSTALFVISYLPMLVKASRSRDLSSYSAGNLLIANIGNLAHSVYVFSLPFGPIWFLHIFYLLSTAMMLGWWCRYHWLPSRNASRSGMPADLNADDHNVGVGQPSP